MTANLRDTRLQFIGALTILFWAFQTELWWFALPMALIFEARFYLNRRWALTKQDFYRIADLTSIGLVGMVAFLFMNRQEYHFITTLLSWIPILLFPLMAVLAYSTTPRMSLDVLFYSLRRQREPVQQSWDMDYVFLGACLLAAGLNRDGNYYFAIVAAITFLLLFNLRSTRFSKPVVILSMCLIFLSAFAVHTGIRTAHMGLKKQTELWISNWISQRTDPFKTRTALGKVGRLKLSDAIAFRIRPDSGQPDFPATIMEAVYNTSSGTNWETFDTRFGTVPHADDFTWEFLDEETSISPRVPIAMYPQSRIYLEFDRERSLIPTPMEVVEIDELAATEVAISEYGSVQGTGLIPAPHYNLRYDNRITLGSAPGPMDLEIPDEHRITLHQITLNKVALDKLSPDEVIPFVQSYFEAFRYTLYQEDQEIALNPLSHFLKETKAGHCEYFATATTLLLRHLGVPSRYVVGYAVQEWNEDLQMYIVRNRHAHAWAIAYLDGRWIAVDTTPQQWLALEENQSGMLQPVSDFLSNHLFLLQLWWNDVSIEDYERELYIIGLILVLILGWRIATSEQVILEDEAQEKVRQWILPGKESPFFRVETQLEQMGFSRGRGELMANWLLRIERPELLPLLTTHNRWRFDPRGVSIEDKTRLAEQVSEWLKVNQIAEAHQ